MRPTELRKLRLRIEKQRESVGKYPDPTHATRPSMLRLFFMVLWAKITGAGR